MKRKRHLSLVFLCSLVLVCILIVAPTAWVVERGSSRTFHHRCTLEEAECETDRVLYAANPPQVGADVVELQERLTELGLFSGKIDGSYGLSTQESVKQMQHRLGMKTTAIVGQDFWSALSGDDSRAALSQPSTKPLPKQPISLTIDIDRLALTVFSEGRPYHTFPVAIGKRETPSPIGEFRIKNKGIHWGGGFGTRWLGLNVPWGVYGIHGTNKPWSVGRSASHGCFRMLNQHVETLYKWVPNGTPVDIVCRYRTYMPRKHTRLGASGQDVVFLQLALRKAGYDAGRADGRFGERGSLAVKAIHDKFGIPSDGCANIDTQYLIGLIKPNAPKGGSR